MDKRRPRMATSPLWLRLAIVSSVLGFAVLNYLAHAL